MLFFHKKAWCFKFCGLSTLIILMLISALFAERSFSAEK